MMLRKSYKKTLIQYLKTSPILENEAHEKAWLFRVASNLSKNRISYNKIRSTDELNESLIAEERGRFIICLGSS